MTWAYHQRRHVSQVRSPATRAAAGAPARRSGSGLDSAMDSSFIMPSGPMFIWCRCYLITHAV